MVVDAGTADVDVVLEATVVGTRVTEEGVVAVAVVEVVEAPACAVMVATGTRSGDGRVVTSSRTLETADVARTIEAAVAASQARTWPAFRFMWQ